METGIGDKLARGCPSAQFAGASSNITGFENDFMYLTVVEVMEKYGLSQAEYDQYHALRDTGGQHLPDLIPVALQETLDVGFSIKDHRNKYLLDNSNEIAKPKAVKKFPEPEFEPMQTLLDRVLVMVISDDPNVELLEDGSSRDLRTGLITAAAYRQHSNVGIVLLAGQWVVSGGVKTFMCDILKPGDRVIYGDYNSEIMPMSDEQAQVLCEQAEVNYEKTAQGLRIVRVQDIRTIQRRKVMGNWPHISPYSYFSGTIIPATPVNGPMDPEEPNV
jgi:co-chaperonin GroES (HSP10)